jgi:co-chaperonin GroES (HSP10)
MIPIPQNCKVGDRVLYHFNSGQQLILNGIMWHVFGDCDVLKILDKDADVRQYVNVRAVATQ